MLVYNSSILIRQKDVAQHFDHEALADKQTSAEGNLMSLEQVD